MQDHQRDGAQAGARTRHGGRQVLLFGALCLGMAVTIVGFTLNPETSGRHAGVETGQAADGKKAYQMRCVTCHGANGQGMPGVFPPLDGAEWVTGDKGRLIRIVLHGMTEEVEVKGVKYSGAMPAWGSFMSDAEVAAVASFVRSSWSNKASAVTEAEVAAVRAATKSRKSPWTAKELVTSEHSGIPGSTTAKASGR